MKLLKGSRLMLGASVLCLFSNAANAQESGLGAQDSSGNLDVIVVTAERGGAQDLQEVPVAVTAISGDVLDQQNVVNILDLSALSPSLVIGTRAGTGSADGGIAIRGMGVDAQDSQGAVGVYVDEVFFAGRQGNLLGLLDPERIEVLRGPQGTLFGRNTLAGAIQYVSKSPSHKFEGYVSGTIGEVDRYEVQGAINIPLGDIGGIRFAGIHSERGGFMKSQLNGDKHGSEQFQAFRVRALLEPTDRLSIDLKYEKVSEERGPRPVVVLGYNPLASFPVLATLSGADIGDPSQYVFTSDDTIAGFNSPDFFEFDFESFQGTLSYDITDDITVKSITAFQTYDPFQVIDFDNTPAPITTVAYLGDTTESLTQEFQVGGSLFDGVVDFTTGFYYFDYEREQSPVRETVIGNGGPNFSFPNPDVLTEIESVAFYGRLGINVTDDLSLDFGIRYTDETVSSTMDAFPPITTESNMLEQKFTDWSPHIGVNYKFGDGYFVYAKASKGFRAGGFTPDIGLPGGAVAFDPETAWTYEAGLRLEFHEIGLRFNPTIYLTDWSDIQFNTIDFSSGRPIPLTANAGSAEIMGLELETVWAATDNLKFTGTLSLMDSKYTEVDPSTGVFLDTPLQLAPDVSYSLGAMYTFPLDSGADIVANVTYSFVDERTAAAQEISQELLDSYNLVNARIQYTSPNDTWSLALYASNLFDEFYYVGGTRFDNGGTVGLGAADVARPREIGLEARFNF